MTYTVVVQGTIPVWTMHTIEADDDATALRLATEEARMAAARHENGAHLGETGITVDFDGPVTIDLDSAEIAGATP